MSHYGGTIVYTTALQARVRAPINGIAHVIGGSGLQTTQYGYLDLSLSMPYIVAVFVEVLPIPRMPASSIPISATRALGCWCCSPMHKVGTVLRPARISVATKQGLTVRPATAHAKDNAQESQQRGTLLTGYPNLF